MDCDRLIPAPITIVQGPLRIVGPIHTAGPAAAQPPWSRRGRRRRTSTRLEKGSRAQQRRPAQGTGQGQRCRWPPESRAESDASGLEFEQPPAAARGCGPGVAAGPKTGVAPGGRDGEGGVSGDHANAAAPLPARPSAGFPALLALNAGFGRAWGLNGDQAGRVVLAASDGRRAKQFARAQVE